MNRKEASNLRDLIFVIGFIIMFAGYFWSPLVIIGFVVTLSGIIPDYLYNRCPHCKKRLGRNAGEFCQHCGEKID